MYKQARKSPVDHIPGSAKCASYREAERVSVKAKNNDPPPRRPESMPIGAESAVPNDMGKKSRCTADQ